MSLNKNLSFSHNKYLPLLLNENASFFGSFQQHTCSTSS
jgi:hypothetical protein